MRQHRRFARDSCASLRQRIASAWRVVPLLLACLALGFAAAQSVSQEAALGFRDPRLIDLEARLADALQRVEAPSGVGYSAIARPRVSVPNRLDLEDGPSWSHGIGAVGAVTYRYDPVALVREVRAATAQTDLSDAEAAFARGDIDRLRLAELQLARDEAEAAQLQAELFRLPKEVRLTASYAAERVTVGTEMGMFNRAPGAEVTLGYPGATNPNWTIGLRAEIVIDDALVTAIDDARERVERAEQALTDYLADYPDQVGSARQLVVFAEEIANLERDLADLERDLDRALTTLERSEGALLKTWNAYLGQVYTYLRIVQGGWEVR